MSNPIKSQTDNYWFSHQSTVGTAAYLYVNNIDKNPLREILASRFEDGAKWSMVETTRLNPYVSQFIEMLILLGVFDHEMVSEESDGAGAGAPGDQSGYAQRNLPGMSD